MSTQRIAGLDGLRGLAAIMVIASHALFPAGNSVGGLGVGIFFALSGSLCGGLLLDGQSWRDFYMRRAMRILPLYFVVAAASLSVVASTQQYPAWAIWTLNINHAATFVGQGLSSQQWPLWTVAVEVHLYVILPWVVRERRILWILILLAPICRTVCVLAESSGVFACHGADYFLTICRMDGILCGVILARWQHENSPMVSRLAALAPALLAIRCCFLIDVPPASSLWWVVRFVEPWCGVAIVAWVSERRPGWLAAPILVWLGSISYSTYLLHGFFTGGIGSMWQTVRVLQWTLPLAWASFVLFERSIQRWAQQMIYCESISSAPNTGA